MMRKKRRKYFVDPQVQGLLLRRATRYWFLSLALVGALTVLGWVFVSPGIGALISSQAQLSAIMSAFAVAVGVAMLLLPIALMDLTRVSNRFVGPMYRLRNHMQRAAMGEPVDSVHFRDDDVWGEFAVAFNALNDRLKDLEREVAKSKAESSSTAPEHELCSAE